MTRRDRHPSGRAARSELAPNPTGRERRRRDGHASGERHGRLGVTRRRAASARVEHRAARALQRPRVPCAEVGVQRPRVPGPEASEWRLRAPELASGAASRERSCAVAVAAAGATSSEISEERSRSVGRLRSSRFKPKSRIRKLKPNSSVLHF